MVLWIGGGYKWSLGIGLTTPTKYDTYFIHRLYATVTGADRETNEHDTDTFLAANGHYAA